MDFDEKIVHHLGIQVQDPYDREKWKNELVSLLNFFILQSCYYKRSWFKIGLVERWITLIIQLRVPCVGDLVACMGGLVTCMGDLVTCVGDLVTCVGDLVTCVGDLVTCVGDLVTCVGDLFAQYLVCWT